MLIPKRRQAKFTTNLDKSKVDDLWNEIFYFFISFFSEPQESVEGAILESDYTDLIPKIKVLLSG